MNSFVKLSFLKWRTTSILLSILLYFTSQSFAGIADDLKPIDGYVVKTIGNEVLIDLDAKNNIHRGDIFCVIGPGEQLVHPVTKKVIGKLEKIKGVLKVIRIGEGYSYTRPIGESAAAQPGDQIRRFAPLKAVFWDYSGNARPLYDRLQNTLTSLSWQDYTTSQLQRPSEPSPLEKVSDALIFIVQNNMLEIRDAQFDLIRTYPLDETGPSLGAATTPPVIFDTIDKSSASLPGHVPAQPVSDDRTAPLIDFGSAGDIAGLSDNTMMAEILKRNGQHLLAATNGHTISIFELEDHLKLLAEGKVDRFGHILTVKWWQPKADGPAYLAVLAWTDEKVDSTIFSFENNLLVAISSGLDTILGSFDLDQDGRPETLLSQEFQADSFFGRRIKEMYWRDSHLAERNAPLQLPAKFTVIGSQLADLTGDGQLEAAYVRNGTLWIYSKEKRLYVSPQQMGGSLSALTYKVDPTLLDYRSTSVFFEITPIAVDVDADGRKELLVVSSDQSAIKAPGMMTTIDESRIMVFDYENNIFVKGTVGDPVDASIQGLGTNGRQILFVATEPGAPLAQGGASRLRTLELAL